jgi:hypothetical protein
MTRPVLDDPGVEEQINAFGHSIHYMYAFLRSTIRDSFVGFQPPSGVAAGGFEREDMYVGGQPYVRVNGQSFPCDCCITLCPFSV